ncbi:MAG TPA: CHRD domain-containing protein [Terriglobia bacterium]|nr:CHRD domain-containing protein [Terriglobia bacterium]
MTSKKTVMWFLASLALGFHWFAISSEAQSAAKFRGRLSPVPALGIPAASVAGVGSTSAALTGRKLVVTGSFEKMASPATVAHLSLGQLPGVRGDSVFDLTVSKAGDGTSGTIAGNFDLTPDQVDALKKGRFYVQIHSEGAPNGHLLGWLLSDVKK